MDKYEEFFNVYKEEMKIRTEAFPSYGRGFIIFYNDPECRETILQFNVAGMTDFWALGPGMLSFICDAVKVAKAKLMFKIAGE